MRYGVCTEQLDSSTSGQEVFDSTSAYAVPHGVFRISLPLLETRLVEKEFVPSLADLLPAHSTEEMPSVPTGRYRLRRRHGRLFRFTTTRRLPISR